ncbi:ABC transporter ATP-binding protein [Anaerolineales bacterium HSG24]|nr:ABC transporter ATP-binding protein [Anaerolineales bacterium HSG24]
MILQVKNLITRFYSVDGVVYAINGVNFALDAGETLAVVGESGSGKSVTMMSLLGLIPQPPGKIEGGQAFLFENGEQQDLLKMSDQQIRRVRGGKVGFIFQDPISSLNPTMTIGKQIAESMTEHLGLNRLEARKRTVELLNEVGIADADRRFDSYPHEFSGGMRQRVMIAIAVACQPKIVIADEPTTALDVTVQAQIIELVQRLQEQLGIAIVWITHDLAVVASMADRVLVMYGGTVVEDALVNDLFDNPQHPYTIGLLKAIPGVTKMGAEERLESIEGAPPDLLRELTFCPFAPRCQFVSDQCLTELPPLITITKQHRAACFYDAEKRKIKEKEVEHGQ